MPLLGAHYLDSRMSALRQVSLAILHMEELYGGHASQEHCLYSIIGQASRKQLKKYYGGLAPYNCYFHIIRGHASQERGTQY